MIVSHVAWHETWNCHQKSDWDFSFVNSSGDSISPFWLVLCRSKAFIQIQEDKSALKLFDQQAVQPNRSNGTFFLNLHKIGHTVYNSDFMLNKTDSNSWRFWYLYRGKKNYKISAALVMWHIAWLRYITLKRVCWTCKRIQQSTIFVHGKENMFLPIISSCSNLAGCARERFITFLLRGRIIFFYDANRSLTVSLLS